ncbi:hypothetical protein SprV_0802517600 [Sparganum proliferum]
MGAQMFFSLLPSEISRLVLGYLAENGCYEACNTFFLECSHLAEIRGQFPSAYDITCRVGGISLMDILHDYIRTVNLINEELEARSPTWTSSPSAACRPGQTSSCLRTFISRYCSVNSGISSSSPSPSCSSSSVSALMATSQRSQPAPFPGTSSHPAYRPQQSRIAMARHSSSSSSIQSFPPVPSAAGFSTAATSSAAAIFVPLHPIVTGTTRPLRARFQMATIQTIQNRCSPSSATATCPSVPLLRPLCPPVSNVLWPTPASAACTTVVPASDSAIEILSSHKRKRPLACRPLDAPSPGDQVSVQKGLKIHSSPTKEVDFERIISTLMVNARTVADRINTSIDSITTGPRQRTSMDADKSPSPPASVASLPPSSSSSPRRQTPATACTTTTTTNSSGMTSPGTSAILLASPNPEFEGLVEQLLKEMEQSSASSDGHADQPLHNDDDNAPSPAAVLTPRAASPAATDSATSVNSAEGQLTGFLCPLSPEPVTGSTQCLSAPTVSTDDDDEEEEEEAAAKRGSEVVLQEGHQTMDSAPPLVSTASASTVQTSLPRPATPPFEPRSRSPHFSTSMEQHLSTAPPVSSSVPTPPTATVSVTKTACHEQSLSHFPSSSVGTCSLSSYPIVSSRVKLLTPPCRPADAKPLTPKVLQPPLMSASFAPPPAVNLFPCSPETPATEIHPCFTQFKPDPDLTNLGFSGSTPFGGFGASCPLSGEDNDLSWFFEDVNASIRAAEATHPKTGASTSSSQSEPSNCLSAVSTPTTMTTTTSTSMATVPLVVSSTPTAASTLLSSPPPTQQQQPEQQCQTNGLFDHSSLLTPNSGPQTLPPPLSQAHNTTTTTTSPSTLLVSSNSWLRVVDLSALEVQPICLPPLPTPQPIAPNPSPGFLRPPLRFGPSVAVSVVGAPPIRPKLAPLGENTTVLGQTDSQGAAFATAATRSYPNLLIEPKKAPKYTSSRFLRAVEGGVAKRPSEEGTPCRPSPDSTSTCSPGSEKPAPAKIRKTKRKKMDLTQLDVAGILSKLH